MRIRKLQEDIVPRGFSMENPEFMFLSYLEKSEQI